MAADQVGGFCQKWWRHNDINKHWKKNVSSFKPCSILRPKFLVYMYTVKARKAVSHVEQIFVCLKVQNTARYYHHNRQ